jgi:hypothetical protein
MHVRNKQGFECQDSIPRDKMCNGIIEHNDRMCNNGIIELDDRMCNGIIEHDDRMCNGIIERDDRMCNDDYLNENGETFLDNEVLNDMDHSEGYDKEKTECEHKYVLDLIDVDPERSQVIEYCEKCFHVID